MCGALTKTPEVHNTRERLQGREGSKAEGRYDKSTPSMRTRVRKWKDVCACPVVESEIMGASMEGCDVSTVRNSIIRKTRVQRKSGPATPPARVAMRATTTNPALTGPKVVCPAFLFWCFTDPAPGGTVTLRKECVGHIVGVEDL